MNLTASRLHDVGVGTKVLVVSLLISLISMFLPWYSESSPYGNSSYSGFHEYGLAFFLFWLITAAFLTIRVFDLRVNLPGLSLVDWQLYIIGGFVMLVSGLLYYVNVPSGTLTAANITMHWGVSFGWWLALVASAGVIAGGWLSRPGIVNKVA